MPSSPPHSTETLLQIHTYHCLCTTHLLTTPYALSSLPRRAAPALDKAIILPLGSFSSSNSNSNSNNPPSPKNHSNLDHDPTSTDEMDVAMERERKERILPSLLSPSLRAARKIIVVRREDGFEKRRMWRCGRCGTGVGYEVVGSSGESEGGRVMFLLEGGMRELDEEG